MSKNYLMLLLGALLFFNACKEDEDPLTNNDTPAITALVDGVQWTAVSSTMSASMAGGLINITGISSDNQVITITLDADKAGTYLLSAGQSHVMAYTQNNSASEPAFTSNAIENNIGKVVITEIDTDASTISGTFTGPVLRSADNKQVEITDGVFTNVTLTTEVVTEEPGYYLKADIDGTEWKAPFVSGSTLTGELALTGSNISTYKTISFRFPMDIAVGTYTLEDIFSDYGAQYNVNQTMSLMAASGTLVVTKHDMAAKEISGTFSFEAEEFGQGSATASLKNGSFNISY